MSTTYPSTKQTFTDPSGTQNLGTPSHSALHTDHNDTVEAIQDTIGTTAGTNVLKNFSAGQFPLRVTGGGAVGTHVTTVVGGTLDHTTLVGTPQITGGTILNAALIGTSQITGGSVSNAVIGTPTLQAPIYGSNSIPGSALSTSAVLLAYTQITSDFTTTSNSSTQVTNLSGTVTVPSGGRMVKITLQAGYWGNDAGNKNVYGEIWKGAVTTGTRLQLSRFFVGTSASFGPLNCVALETPAAGLGTYNAALFSDASGTARIVAGTTNPAFILVELV